MKTENPIALFKEWQADAAASGIKEPTAMVLATANPEGQPSARTVLLKQCDEQGFVFYTNSLSHKGRDLLKNPKAALLFYWMDMQKQVRVEGRAVKVSDAESDAYFAGRPRESQIGAWASKQSEVLESKEALLARMEELRLKYDGMPIPRPPHWFGFRIVPEIMEFWQEGEFRIHHSRRFTKTQEGWEVILLNP